MAEIEATLERERLDKDMVLKKGKAYCKDSFMVFNRKITDLSIRLQQLPPEQRNNVQSALMQKMEK